MKTSPANVIRFINNSSKTLFILCGLPYSGKTYLSKKILANTSCLYVSVDKILELLGYNWDLNELPDSENWKRVMDLSYQQIREGVKSGLNVLYDATNHTKASRDKLRAVGKDVSADSVIIYLDVQLAVIRKRWEKNRKTQERFVLDERLLDETIRALEIPSEDENAIIVRN